MAQTHKHHKYSCGAKETEKKAKRDFSWSTVHIRWDENRAGTRASFLVTSSKEISQWADLHQKGEKVGATGLEPVTSRM